MIQIAVHAQRCSGGRRMTQTWGAEGLWAKRVSERQTNWPFSTLHWQLVIRGNYKGLLATNHLILLWEWEPNVIMALWYTDPVPSGTKPRSQPQQVQTLAQSRADDQNIHIWQKKKETEREKASHLFPAAPASLFPWHGANECLHNVSICMWDMDDTSYWF